MFPQRLSSCWQQGTAYTENIMWSKLCQVGI